MGEEGRSRPSFLRFCGRVVRNIIFAFLYFLGYIKRVIFCKVGDCYGGYRV